MKIVINGKYGGFGLSDEAFNKLIGMGWTVTTFNDKGHYTDPNCDLVDMNTGGFPLMTSMSHYAFAKWKDNSNELRTNPDIIKVIEELGDAADGSHAKLKIVEIPDDVKWHIEEYDGNEWIAEDHRTWS